MSQLKRASARSATKSDSAQDESAEILRLVEVASREGERDIFQGKRRWTRYQLGGRLEVTSSADDHSHTQRVVMHNISGGGLGFWTRDLIPEGATIRVRECCDEQEREWLAARVTHASLGIRGYLIGAAFDRAMLNQATESAPPPDEATAEAPAPAVVPTPVPVRPRRSLRATCTRAGALGSGVGTGLGLLIGHYAALYYGAHWLPLATILAAMLVGGLSAWFALGSTMRFFRTLENEIKLTGKVDAPTGPLMGGAFRELGGMITALTALRARWRTREDDERTQRQKLEELNLVKSNILNMVSHDLRTPLTSIRLYAQMLAEGLQDIQAQDQSRFLEIITEECDRLARLVDDLLEAQRLESGRVRWDMRPHDLSRLVRACALVFEPMAQSRSITLQVDCPQVLPHIEADADKMSQVLSNLVSNAIKYTQAGGLVYLSVKATTNEVLVCVSDNGPGIPRDKWDHIFDRFAQVAANFAREVNGVGLGLYIVRQIVERHGGRVWVESEIGQGASFYVALPIQKQEPAAEPREEQTGSAGRVLVCDADPELSARIAQTLRRQDFDVRCVYSGCRMLAQVVECQPDVVMTDLLLPDLHSADLLESLADLKQRHPFKIVAHTYVGNGATLREQGVDVILTRPASAEELIQSVCVAVRKKSSDAKTILLHCPNGVDVRRLASVLSAAGHTPITASNREEALRIAEDYPVDYFLVSQDVLAYEPATARALHATQPDGHLYVAVRKIRRADRHAAEELGATLVVFTPGREEEIAQRMTQDAALVGAPA